MVHMLSLTASCAARPTLTVKANRVCFATLRSRGVNGQVLVRTLKPARRAASVQVVRAASREAEAEDSAKGFLSDKDTQKTAYGLLAVVWGIVAAAKIFATEQFFHHVFGMTVGAGLLGLQRLAGFSSLAPAVAAYTLAKAAKGGHLDSHTYLRQNLGLAVAGTMTLIYLWKTPAGVMEPVYQKLAAGLATLTAIVGGAVYSQTSGHNFNVAKIAEGFGNSLTALLSPDNLNAAMYSFLTVGLGLYSLVLLFGSHELAAQWLVIGSGEVSLFLQREIGLSAFLAAIQTYCLKDAADRQSMGKSTFKTLNLGLAAIATGNASALWYAAHNGVSSWSTQSSFRMAFLALQVVTYAYNWIEGDRDESEDAGRIENAFDSAADGIRDVLNKGEHQAKKLLNKGEDAVDDVKHKGKKYANKAEDQAEDLGDKARGAARDTERKADKWTDKAGDKAEELGDNAKGAARDTERKADKWTDKAGDKAEEMGDNAKGAARDTERKADKWSDKAGDKTEDLGDRAKGAARDTERKADKWGDKAGDNTEDLGDKAKGAVRDTERKADKWTDKAGDKAEELGDKAKGAARDTEREADRLGDRAEGEAKDASRDGKNFFGRRRN